MKAAIYACRLKRALLVIPVFAVLLTAAPHDAEAERAWVLWTEEHITVKNGSTFGPIWTMGQAEPTNAGCKTARDSYTASAVAMAKAIRGATVTVVRDVITLTYPKSDAQFVVAQVVQYHCLPDTIDPRGPKGGSR
jgi:hypothetical protein